MSQAALQAAPRIGPATYSHVPGRFGDAALSAADPTQVRVHGRAGAPGLLLLNTPRESSSVWSRYLPLLTKHFRVMTCDIPAQSSLPTAAQLTKRASIAFDALDRHGFDTATVIGHSLGGMTALTMGAGNPGRVDRILCCGLGTQPGICSTYAAKVAVPVLFLSGEQEAIAPHKAPAPGGTGAEHIIVRGASNAIHVTRPDDFAIAMIGFLGLDIE